MMFPEGNKSDLRRYAERVPINMVSIQLTSRRFAQIHKTTGRAAFEESVRWADSLLDVSSELGITAVLDFSLFPLDPEAPDQTTPVFWKNDLAISEVIAVAGELARRFKGRGRELAAYKIMSEPVVRSPTGPLEPPKWPAVLQAIVSSIRKHDPNRWIVVQPGPWGLPDGYTQFRPPVGHRLIWGAHAYAPHAFTHQGIGQWPLGPRYPGKVNGKIWNKNALEQYLYPLIAFQAKNPRPVWIGEFGALRWADGAEQYLIDVTSLFDAHGWGWTYHSAVGWHGWNPDYDDSYGDNVQSANHLVHDRSKRWSTLRKLFAQ